MSFGLIVRNELHQRMFLDLCSCCRKENFENNREEDTKLQRYNDKNIILINSHKSEIPLNSGSYSCQSISNA